jgi:hypothetical protein
MQIEVSYGERTYGTGFGATDYKVKFGRQKLYKLGRVDDRQCPDTGKE